MQEMEDVGIKSSISSILSPKRSPKRQEGNVVNASPAISNSKQQGDPSAEREYDTVNASSISSLPAPDSPVATTATERSPVDDDAPLLQHDENDEGCLLQMFSFLKNDWVDVRVEGFDDNSGAHKISYVGTGKQEWQNLRRKALRRCE